ncbi:S-adenosyl-L-methionine-dependent methyltransferase [Staphylotrichum tortipilum]|uniref:S-adenosyl-L-methionine-dependent methyltransferase n=1 Tax=Staphylotrichum tortipilum TaxID=2831512 RepID=A0AAN6MH58_9PEZI|nr:S-adenosyl-L-methionine-dependent methyltransferase [Staphylotrichum longicolle]
MASQPPPKPTSWQDDLLPCYLHKPSERPIVAERFLHRLNLCEAWSIPPGSHILDIGCGQGESALVLASQTGPAGHVTGIDTAPPGYGGPYTLLQAQAHIAASPLGSRITFLATDAPSLLAASPQPRFGCAILCHSLWYFPSAQTISSLFSRLAEARITRLCLAEYTGVARTPEQEAHALAAAAEALLIASRRPRERIQDWNVRTALSPGEILQLAGESGWRVEREGVLEAPEGLVDGWREAGVVRSRVFEEAVKEEGLEGGVEERLLGMARRVGGLCEEVERGEGKVRCMDVFWAVLTLEGGME